MAGLACQKFSRWSYARHSSEAVLRHTYSYFPVVARLPTLLWN